MTDYPIARAVAVDAGVERVIVGGKNITQFRASAPGDQPTKVPGYTNIEPFGYGASQPLVIPRTNCHFERYGTGDLAWLKKGAEVRYQRKIGSTVVTDYRGFITSINTSGREFVCQVAGALSGRAALVDKPPVKIRKVYDLASLMRNAMDTLGFRLAALSDTHIHAANQGGMTWLSWLQTISAYSRTASTVQKTLMPATWGGSTWRFAAKDNSTKHFTVYADGSRIQLELVDDVAEQPTTIYGSGVSPDGERWDGSVWPGLFQGPPEPFPFADTSHTFGVGTMDADTDTDDGITVLVKKLCLDDLLNERLFFDLTEYTEDVEDAVNQLKHLAGLPEDGMMTLDAWNALWDTNIVGFSTHGARIMPLYEAPRVRFWNYSANGSVIGRNPDYVHGSVRVSRTIDFGVCDEDTARRYAQSLVHETLDHEWAGTIVLNDISVFEGERDSAYAAAVLADPDSYTGDVLPARSIRPGMNAWLPYFDGGTLLHVSGVDVQGRTVTLTVSTAALDVYDITQMLKRNQDSKRNVYREWQVSQMGAKAPHNFISRDKHFGRLGQRFYLRGGAWNVWQFPMSQSGTISRVYISLSEDTEFIWGLFGKQVSEGSLTARVGNPFSLGSENRPPWERADISDWFDSRVPLVIEGRGDQPCGFDWRPGYDSSGDRITGNPLTGRFISNATFSYATDPQGEPVVYFAIWPREDCYVHPGRVFYALEDDVT